MINKQKLPKIMENMRTKQNHFISNNIDYISVYSCINKKC